MRRTWRTLEKVGKNPGHAGTRPTPKENLARRARLDPCGDIIWLQQRWTFLAVGHGSAGHDDNAIAHCVLGCKVHRARRDNRELPSEQCSYVVTAVEKG